MVKETYIAYRTWTLLNGPIISTSSSVLIIVFIIFINFIIFVVYSSLAFLAQGFPIEETTATGITDGLLMPVPSGTVARTLVLLALE